MASSDDFARREKEPENQGHSTELTVPVITMMRPARTAPEKTAASAICRNAAIPFGAPHGSCPITRLRWARARTPFVHSFRFELSVPNRESVFQFLRDLHQKGIAGRTAGYDHVAGQCSLGRTHRSDVKIMQQRHFRQLLQIYHRRPAPLVVLPTGTVLASGWSRFPALVVRPASKRELGSSVVYGVGP